MAERIRVRESLCSGCLACVAACSIKRVGFVSPSSSRIHVNLDIFGRNKIEICRQCSNAPCVDACPLGAIVRLSKDGPLVIDYDRCDGCRKCIESCPFSAIFWDPIERKVVKCDLCSICDDESPACVDACPTGALSLIEVKSFQDASLIEGGRS